LLSILCLVGGVGFWTAHKTDALVQSAEFNIHKESLSSAIELAIEKEKVGGRDVLLHDDAKYLTGARAQFAEKMAELEPLLSTPTSRQLFAAIRDANSRYCDLVDQAVQVHGSGDQTTALTLFYGEKAQQARDDLKKSAAGLVDWYAKLAADAQAEQLAACNRAKELILGFTLLGIVIGTMVGVLVIRSLIAAILPIVSVMDSISRHNLSIPDVEVRTEDEIGQAGRALNTMKANLTRMVRSITQSAVQLASATEQIAQGSRETSSSATREAEHSVQVASAMQEMSATVREVADNAQKASDASEQSASAARKGGAIADETLATMSNIAISTGNAAERIVELGKSSEKIGDIVAVITDIAGQTNLLALNAAIEAARAGEQGRGFAVVAGEVRRLAERTAAATQEISAMIQTIQSETKVAVEAIELGRQAVGLGVRKTTETGEALKEIIGMSDRVGSMVLQIATAASEQKAATDQISSSVSDISNLSQTSSLNAHQTADACVHLSELASGLHRLVNEFCVADAEERYDAPAITKPQSAAQLRRPVAA
jgi:methyl-accepting chemotaxis protein